jgi:lipid A 3-O-deacylase
MRLSRLLLSTAAALLLTAPAFAAAPQQDLISLGVGHFDVRESDHYEPATDFRLEYRSGSELTNIFDITYLRPFGGVEVTEDRAVFGLAGIIFDTPIGDNFYIAPNFGAGFFTHGYGKDMGSVFEFRSTFEVGYKFDEGTRVGLSFGHISNAGITKTNHGSEVANIYLHVPLNDIVSAF